jgi:enoyl-CoA hydratase/carnithine racemase
MTSEAAVLFEARGPVGWLILNRPKAMNAINLEVVACVEKYVAQIAADDSIRAVVITGRGPAFCAGGDLKEVLEGQKAGPGELTFTDKATAAFGKLRDLKKPVIAALNGITMAGGLETAMCADLVIAAEDAQIGDAHANFGVFPGGGGAAILPRLIPPNVAKYLLFTGETMSAKDLQAFGFINKVVPGDKLEETTQKLAEKIAAKSPIALRRMKEVVRTSQDATRAEALRHELLCMEAQMRTHDFVEGIKAFSEKRKPEFKGY